jgi:nuclear pore complex protein Nup98-Nup96
MSENERGFHTSFKPRWAADGTLVYSATTNALAPSGNMITSRKPIVSEQKDIRFAQFSSPKDSVTTSLQLQFEQSPITSAETSFAAIAESLAHPETPEAQHERAVWRLTSILFDPIEVGCADLIKNIPTARVAELESRIRRDALSNFWAQLVHAEAAQHAKDASSSEEKAVAFLSGNSIEDACAALLEGRDFRLATIVAQLPGNAKSKDMVAKQIESWRSQNMISEMTESVRALYELVAGNTCISEGKLGAAEDKAAAFGISSRFGLDWRRSFGLRLWFSTANESLADAVQLYVDDIASGKETIRPVPYFTEQSLAPSWNDSNTQGNEDTLLGLLKLYSRQPSSKIGDVRSLVTSLLSPASVSGSPLNARLSWQLATLLQKKGILTTAELSDASLDELSLTLSSQLEAANELVFATNVLLHLTNESARERHIRDLLCRRASALYDASNPGALPTVLTQDFGLPEQWLWHARALYARSMLDDHNAEVTYLLRAGDSAQAHTVLCRTVGPTAIIERDYDSLRELLGLFHDMLPAGAIENWRTGGQVYFDYIHLLDLVNRDDDASRTSKKELLDRLTIALPGLLEGRTGKVDLEERVAVGEMAGLVKAEVEKMGREEKGVDRNIVNRLPVAGGKYAKQGVDLSRAYYRAIVA